MELIEAVCKKTMNPLWLLKGQKVIYHFEPPGWDDFSKDQRPDHQPIVMAINAGHAFFWRCPDARKTIQHMKLDFEPSFSQHAKLVHRTDDDAGIPFRGMMAFSADALGMALEAEESV